MLMLKIDESFFFNHKSADFNINCVEELLDHIKNLHQAALEGQRSPESAMTRVTALIASFVGKNSEVCSEVRTA